MEKTIYLDNAATTFPKPQAVYDIMDYVNRNMAVNAERGSYKLAIEANNIIDDVKLRMKKLVHAPDIASVVLTSSITLALNQILNGIEFKKGDIVYISPYEHNAVARTLQKIRKEKNIEVRIMPANMDTLEIDIQLLKDLFIQEKPKLVCCTHISNVTGYILPIEEIFSAAKSLGAITVLDAAQSLGLINVNIHNIDYLAFTGHKTLYGPFGVGGFINNSKYKLKEYFVGGTGSNSLKLDMPENSPGRYEASSPNIVAIAGLQAALRELNVEKNYLREKELTDYARQHIENIINVKTYIPENKKNHIAIISFNIKNSGMSADEIGKILDHEFNIAVRTGYHCAPYVHDLINDKEYNGTVRIGIGQFNQKSDIDTLCDAIEEII